MDPILKQYIFHKSLLNEGKNRVILSVVLLTFFIASLLGWGILTTNVSAWDILSLTVISGLGSVIGYFILSFLDRERKLSGIHFLIILSVMLLFGPVAAYFNNIDPATRLFTVGFYEEGMKILPVVLLAIFLPKCSPIQERRHYFGGSRRHGF